MQSAVVIPTKNRGAFIGRAVESALNQTLPVSEVIVVDDGSTDNTGEVIRSFADPRVRMIRFDQSVGAPTARNRGVAESRSEWICFLDSDDAWYPEKHAAQAQAIASTPGAVASFTGLCFAFEDSSFNFLQPSSVSDFALRGCNVVGSTSSAMVRRDHFDAVGGFDPSLPSCQDWDLWMKLRQVGDFALVREPLVTFTQDSTGRISKNKDAVFAGHDIVFSRALEGVRNPMKRARIKSLHQQRLAEIMLYDTHQPAAAARAAFLSLALRPTRKSARLFVWSFSRALRGAPA